ncbi:hypothetical protein OHS33_17715 [Streptomyces sp. NBC_00536]|uniref:hypothetical protein n=1 Tax=Streptomyces sp. NBC_00536 TaxID=2975769 RepID=UPI002E8195B1|nr:hypothetical protein [Streptomyces sp. NBC_00536]WUC80020.1 hypothetical protein OHS33_17715 [Streptomyces sp. NBC_00536]
MTRTSIRGKAVALVATSVLALGTGVLAAAPAEAATECKVISGGRLSCGNTPYVDMFRWASFNAPWANTLTSNPSTFECWTKGDYHDGGNNTWYGAYGDVNSNFGMVPASVVSTSSSFDANPGAYGMRHC